MTLKEQVAKAVMSLYKTYVFGEGKQIVFTEDCGFIFPDGFGNEKEVYLIYYIKTNEWELHKSNILTIAQIEAICETLKVEMPFIKANQSRFVDSIANSVTKFPDIIAVPRSHTIDNTNSLRKTTLPTPEKPNGMDIVEGFLTRIVDGKIEQWNGGGFKGQYIPHVLSGDLELPNGELVRVDSVRTKDSFVLTKKKFIGMHKPQSSTLIERLEINYPVDIEGKAMVYNEFWYKPFDNYTYIQKEICESGLEIPDDFWFDRCVNHFYGKSFERADLKEYIKTFKECECERCQGFDVMKSTNLKTHMKGFNFVYYQMIHAGIFGKAPSGDEMITDCNCKGCAGLRKRKTLFRNSKKKIFVSDMLLKGYDNNEIKYVLMAGRSLPKIKPSKCIPLAKQKDEIDFEQFSTNINVNNWREGSARRTYDINEMFHDLVMRDSYALLHCRFNNIPLSNLKTEARRWKQEVFNTQLNPECDCHICHSIKHTSNGFNRVLFNELMLEPIDARVYPTSIFEYHFGDYNAEKSKEAYLDYFNKYILWAKFCDCERCTKYQKRAEAMKFLPPDELKSPKCPGCGRGVHNKDLLFLNAEVAKKIIEQDIDKTIKIKTAFCCSCYGKYSKIFKQKKILQDLNEGSVIRWKGKERTIYYDEDGIKFVGKTRMSEFLNREGSHDAKIVRRGGLSS